MLNLEVGEAEFFTGDGLHGEGSVEERRRQGEKQQFSTCKSPFNRYIWRVGAAVYSGL
jgi:hypothetical protein